MFTGLIEEVGRIERIEQSVDGIQMVISCSHILSDLKVGDSVAVDGVCLTATHINPGQFQVDVMPETLSKSHLSMLQRWSLVHLERALAVGERMGGHFVQGHVDGVATLVERIPEGNSTRYRFQTESQLTHWMVEKGSITINGVSLTLVEAGSQTFAVSLIPHTLENTHFSTLQSGDQVNIECDLVGKYLAKWTSHPEVVSH